MKKLILFLAIASGNFLSFNLNAQTFPAGFSELPVATVYYPTSVAFAPDGRIFVTEKAGKVKIIKNGSILPTPFLQVTVDQLDERGLSSVAIDPDFNNNHYVYIYYTSTSGTIHNRLSRLTANGDVAVPGSEFVILEIEPAVNSLHNAGGMVFGSDGTLYIGIGDDGADWPINYTNPNSQNLNTYKGKVLRINTDGSVPSGNPFSGSAAADRIWACGFRNPWTLSIQPNTNKIFVNDVGQEGPEEINDVTTGGKNFGWPFAEGPSTNPAYTNPVYVYYHGPNDSIGCAITGGAFFNPSSTNYPGQYTGSYFFMDYCNKEINYIDPNNAVKQFNFASSIGGSNNYLKVGDDGNLYYFSISQSTLYKIIFNFTTSIQNKEDHDNPQSEIYPNPMLDLATIKYRVKKNEFVKLDVFEMSGKKVETVVNEIKPAGEYNVLITKNNLSKGVYFYKLQIGDAFEVKKIVIQ